MKSIKASTYVYMRNRFFSIAAALSARLQLRAWCNMGDCDSDDDKKG